MLKGACDSGHKVRALESLFQMDGIIRGKSLIEGGS
jgi:hypothetical protein